MRELIVVILGYLCKIISTDPSSSPIFTADDVLSSFFDTIEIDPNSEQYDLVGTDSTVGEMNPPNDEIDKKRQYFHTKFSDNTAAPDARLISSITNKKTGFGKIDISIQYDFDNTPEQSYPEQNSPQYNDNLDLNPSARPQPRETTPAYFETQYNAPNSKQLVGQIEILPAKDVDKTSRLNYPPALSYDYEDLVNFMSFIFRSSTASYEDLNPSTAPDNNLQMRLDEKPESRRYNNIKQYNKTLHRPIYPTTERPLNNINYYSKNYPLPTPNKFVPLKNIPSYRTKNPHDNNNKIIGVTVNSYGFVNPSNRGHFQALPGSGNIAMSSTPMPVSESMNVETSNAGQTGGNPVPNSPRPSYFLTEITPRSVFHHVNKIVIDNSPTKEVYIKDDKTQFRELTTTRSVNNEENEYKYTQHLQAKQTYYTPTQNTQPIQNFDYQLTETSHESTTPYLLLDQNEPHEFIQGSRRTFETLKSKCFDLFIKGTMDDFRQILYRKIEEKCTETLPEEEKMLSDQSNSNKDQNSLILDYLTVYERYADLLNDTSLSYHILQDIERAKEYLNMKLNKFWLELDEMDTPEEFEDKRDYYKNREKPTGLMNLLYEWFEKLATNPQSINEKDIQTRITEIMKIERRYWLLLINN